MTSLRATAAAVPMLLIALTGCSGDGAPEAESTFTPTATPTPTPTPSPSGEATPTTPAQGPEETVEAWVAARNVALSDGDIAAVLNLSADECRTCMESVQPIADIYAAGGTVETEGWRIAASRVKSETDDRAVVPAGLVYSPGVTINSEGSDPVTFEKRERLATFKLRQVDGVWLVSFLGFLS